MKYPASLLALALAISALGCRPAELSQKRSLVIPPVCQLTVDSFFPDGPTAGYRVDDIWAYPDRSVSANEGMHFKFLRELPPAREEQPGFRFELLSKEAQVLQTFPTSPGTTTEGGTDIHAIVKGNPEASGYRLVSLGGESIENRPFPSFQDFANTELRRLKDGRYILTSPGHFMSFEIFFSQDLGRRWGRATISLGQPFKKDDLQGVLKDLPVLIDIRAASPGRYFSTRFQLP